jgi:ParB/RepB/Spo0J family partition protein
MATTTPRRKAATTTTTTKKKATPKASAESTDNVEVTNDTVVNPVLTETPQRLLYGFPVLAEKIIAIGDITKKFNIRSQKNEEANDAELQASIKTSGVLNPVIINDRYELLDGYRRFYNAKKVGVKEVPATIVDVPDNQIALFQYLCGLEKGLTKEENSDAILKYSVDNPDELDIDIAKKFGVSHTTVSNITKIQRKAPSLAVLVAEKRISQRSALKVVEESTKHRKNAEECAVKLINQIKPKLAASKAPIKSGEIIRALKEVIPGVSFKEEKGKTEPNTRKLLQDLFLALKPVGDAVGNKQEYTAILNTDFMNLIGTVLGTPNFSTAVPQLSKEPEEKFTVTHKTKKLAIIDNGDIIKTFLDESFANEDKSIFVRVDDTLYCLDEQADFWSEQQDINGKFEVINGLSWYSIDSKDVDIAHGAKNLGLNSIVIIQLLIEGPSTPTTANIVSELPIIEALGNTLKAEIAEETGLELDLEGLLSEGVGIDAYDIDDDDADLDEDDDDEEANDFM